MCLLEDGFDMELNLADRWKRSMTENFDSFCKEDSFVERAFGASMSGMCFFEAFKRTAELSGRPDIVTDTDIEDFEAGNRRDYGIELREGVSWKVFLVFLRRLRNIGRNFAFNAMTNNNFVVAGRRGARVLQELDLFDGLYLIGAYNHQFVGHVIVLQVAGKSRLVYDGDKGKSCKSCKSVSWINFFAFIRPFKVFAK